MSNWINIPDDVLLKKHKLYLFKGTDYRGRTIWQLSEYCIEPVSDKGAYRSLTLLLKSRGILL